MKKEIVLFSIGVSLASIASSAFAGPGYVSRDCPAAGAKESITVDWSYRGEWFYTESWHLRKVGTSYNWEKHTSGSGWAFTWRSYAGQVLSYISNYYYSGVYGVHYWYNRNTKSTEVRRQFVTTCNLESWGYNNW